MEDEEETFSDDMELLIFPDVELLGDEFWLLDKFPDAVISDNFLRTSKQNDRGMVVRRIND